MVPLTINYVDKTNYGIWITVYSVVTLLGFFELGLGQGLRNRFAEAKAHQDHTLARTYVSTAYALSGLLTLGFYLLFLGIFPFVDWAGLFKIEADQAESFLLLIVIVFSYFALQMLFRLIGMILTADQRPAIDKGIETAGSVLSLIIIFILTLTTDGSLIALALTVCGVSLVIKVLATIWLFTGPYKQFRPAWKHIDFGYTKKLMGLGLQFFVMQIAGVVVYSTDYFIIYQLFDPDQVPSYFIAYKYFNIILILFNIISYPLWSASTDAYIKNDFEWIRATTRKTLRFWFMLLGLTAVMLLLANPFYEFWVGDDIQVPFMLSLFMSFLVLMHTFGEVFYYIVYGSSKIRISLYVSVFAAVVNIPLSWYFAKVLDLGIAGVTLATLVSLAPNLILAPMQYYKIINKTSRGIWDK